MPRKRKNEPAPISEALDDLKIDHKLVAKFVADMNGPPLTTAAELAPPEREVVEPSQQPRAKPVNGTEYPTFAEKIASQRKERGPRKRDPNEPANVFASDSLRIDRDGHMMQVTARRELTGDEKDFISRQGFTPVDDEERVFNGSQKDINRARGDVNAIGFLVGKGGRAR